MYFANKYYLSHKIFLLTMKMFSYLIHFFCIIRSIWIVCLMKVWVFECTSLLFVTVYSKLTQWCIHAWILSSALTHLFEMMCHLYFISYKLFNYMYIHQMYIILIKIFYFLFINFFFFSFTFSDRFFHYCWSVWRTNGQT